MLLKPAQAQLRGKTDLVIAPDDKLWELPFQALLADDMAANLRPAKALGMTTVWVDNGSERGNHAADPAVNDHRIDNVADWLETILEDRL